MDHKDRLVFSRNAVRALNELHMRTQAKNRSFIVISHRKIFYKSTIILLSCGVSSVRKFPLNSAGIQQPSDWTVLGTTAPEVQGKGWPSPTSVDVYSLCACLKRFSLATEPMILAGALQRHFEQGLAVKPELRCTLQNLDRAAFGNTWRIDTSADTPPARFWTEIRLSLPRERLPHYFETRFRRSGDYI